MQILTKKEWVRISIEELNQAADAKEWGRVCELAQSRHEIMPYTFSKYYEKIPQNLRRDFVVGCYEHHGDSVPGCRKALRGLPKNGINELPKAYRDKEYITVYRAGEEARNKAKYRLSWTLDKRVALGFYNNLNYSRDRAHNLYKAKIRPCDVIAYTNERKEKEVLQYRKVYDIEVLDSKLL